MAKHSRIVRIAVLDTEPLFWATCAKRFFSVILQNYSWETQTTTYTMEVSFLSDKMILTGHLNTLKFDLLLIPGGGVGDGHSITKGFKSSLRTRKWKHMIQEFVKQGGGCIGFCGGASLITPMSMGEKRRPTSFVERQYNKSSLDISCITAYYKYLAFPLFNLFQYQLPERIGTTAYVFSFEPGVTVYDKRIHSGGVPLDFKLNKDNPIFFDYSEKTLRIRWWGGQALLIPPIPDREVTILATYPDVDLYQNDATRIHAWKYVGGISGLLRAFFKALTYIKNNQKSLLEFPMLTYYFAGNWELTKHVIESDLAKRPAITTEIYPNEHKARITLCTVHPEYMVWWGGHIQEKKSEMFHCLADGLYQWRDIQKLSDPIDENLTHTWWLVRRLIAWTAKVPDTDLPPIVNQKVLEKDLKILTKNIFWDGTLSNQMENI